MGIFGIKQKTNNSAFAIAHPNPELQETHDLTYSSVGTPTAGDMITRFHYQIQSTHNMMPYEEISRLPFINSERGMDPVKMKEPIARLTIDLPPHYAKLHKNVTVVVSPLFGKGFGYGAYTSDPKHPERSRLEITFEGEGAFNIMIISTRNDNYANEEYSGENTIKDLDSVRGNEAAMKYYRERVERAKDPGENKAFKEKLEAAEEKKHQIQKVTEIKDKYEKEVDSNKKRELLKMLALEKYKL